MHGFEHRRRRYRDVAFLFELPCQRFSHRLAYLDATAGQLPAGNVGVADEEDRIALAIVDETTYAKGHRSLQQEQRMEESCSQARPARLAEGAFGIAADHFR